MRRNCRVSKRMSVWTRNSIHIGAIVVMTFVMLLINLLASSSCQQLMKSIGEKERQLASLENSRIQEANRWDSLKTPEKIEAALLRHGLRMAMPRADQYVHMKADGTPYSGQLSVRRAQQRLSAQYRAAPSKGR